MDEYIEQVQNSIGSQSNHAIEKPSRFRELFSYVVASKPDVKILEKCSPDGDIRFEVSSKSLGITYDTMMKYKNEIMSDYAISFIGELVIREHLSKFTKVLMELKDNYFAAVNKYEHKKFGLRIYSTKFVFYFHASLLQNILTEDFKKQV